ncbi:MAG: CHAD domain-containing protein [Acidobacteriota bacterium]
MTRTLHYPLPAEMTPEQVLHVVGEHLSLAKPTVATETWMYYDTFDWRLHNTDGILLTRPGRRRDTTELLWLTNGEVSRRIRLDGTMPAFARDLPASAFRDALLSITDVRCLVPVIRVERRIHTAAMLNKDAKTTARLSIVERYADEPTRRTDRHTLTPVVEVEPLRGYDAEAKKLEKTLAKRLDLEPGEDGQLSEALAACGRRSGDYTSKVVVDLTPDEPAEQASRAIHRALLTQLLRNEPGVRDDLDPEFLHDFRVATRRTRSALSQIKGVYPVAVTNRFKDEFRWLQQLTNRARDLDVLREDLRRDLELLPAGDAAELLTLDTFLAEERQKEQTVILDGLDSARWRDLVHDWRLFLDSETGEPPPDAPHAGRPMAEVAAERLKKLGARVRKDALAIQPDSPPEVLHALRIDGKKLRYLLEFFRTLLSKDATRLVKRMKTVQDALGDWHDAEQQQIALRHAADSMAQRGDIPVGTLLALGRLLARLDERWAAERKRVDDVIGTLVDAIDDDRIAKLVRR